MKNARKEGVGCGGGVNVYIFSFALAQFALVIFLIVPGETTIRKMQMTGSAQRPLINY